MAADRPYIIAEPGGTAEGKLDVMLRQIEVAAACGCNAFKSQWTSSAERMVERRRAPKYLECYRWLQWPVEWHWVLSEKCAAVGIEYGCSVYLADDPARVARNVSFIKVSSFEATDRDLVIASSRLCGRVYVSLGMTDAADVWKRGWPLNVTLLHCVSAYPARLEDMNLRAIDRSHCAGLSDHSRYVTMGGLAVAAGASVLEVHFRLHTCDPSNPDFAVAFTPDQLQSYVLFAREAEIVMGDGVKRQMPGEAAMAQYRVKP